MPLSYFGQQVVHIAFLNLIKLQNVVPLSSTSKSVPIHSNLTLHIFYIIFEEKVVGTFKEMGRIKYSCNFVIPKPEERVFSETLFSFKALTLLVPMSHMVAATSSAALWQASRTSV